MLSESHSWLPAAAHVVALELRAGRGGWPLAHLLPWLHGLAGLLLMSAALHGGHADGEGGGASGSAGGEAEGEDEGEDERWQALFGAALAHPARGPAAGGAEAAGEAQAAEVKPAASAYLTHPHFLCICLRCGSGRVYVEPAFVWQPEQGIFSRLGLVCRACGERAELFEVSPQPVGPHV